MDEQSNKMSPLLALEQRTKREIERLQQELRERVEPASAADDDSADMAAEIYERGKLISTIGTLENKLHALEHAIEVAEQGHYGICEKCGVEIPEERLELVPESTLCVRCASELEQGIRRHRIATSGYNRGAPPSTDDDN